MGRHPASCSASAKERRPRLHCCIWCNYIITYIICITWKFLLCKPLLSVVVREPCASHPFGGFRTYSATAELSSLSLCFVTTESMAFFQRGSTVTLAALRPVAATCGTLCDGYRLGQAFRSSSNSTTSHSSGGPGKPTAAPGKSFARTV